MKKTAEYSLTKAAAYSVNVSMAVVATVSPLLFSTFYSEYGISYSLLGLLVLINFCTQLGVDLLFSFCSHKFNIALTVRLTPVLTVAGIVLFSVLPLLFPQYAYAGLALGTVVFAASGGLSEVLISPLIAAIPSPDPERAMSRLHSVYAWGVVGVVLVSSGLLLAIGRENWQWLVLGWGIVPAVAAVLFFFAKMPPVETPEKTSGAVGLFSNKALILCVLCIFFGGASECTMSQWASGYLEQALGMEKIWGDIFGVAMFALMLGLGRSLYGAFGKRIYKVLIFGSAGAAVCYLAAALTPVPVIGLIACGLTGLCVSMLWPGSLIAVGDHIPNANVAVFALMAAGGDLGASVGPQITGLVADAVIAAPAAADFAARFGWTAEQLGMKAGILCCAVFPILAVVFSVLIGKISKNKPYRLPLTEKE